MTELVGFVGTNDVTPLTPELRVFLVRDTATWRIEERVLYLGLWLPGFGEPQRQDSDFAFKLLNGPHDRIVRRRADEKERAERAIELDRAWLDYRWDNLAWP